MQQNPADPTLTFPHTQPPLPGTLVEIAPGVRWFRLPLPYRLDHVNIYLIEDDTGWTVLDTGLGTDVCRTAWEAILSGPLAGQRLTSMIVTPQAIWVQTCTGRSTAVMDFPRRSRKLYWAADMNTCGKRQGYPPPIIASSTVIRCALVRARSG
jgi:hypothetical protein